MNRNDPETIINVAGGQIQLGTSVVPVRSIVGKEKFAWNYNNMEIMRKSYQ